MDDAFQQRRIASDNRGRRQNPQRQLLVASQRGKLGLDAAEQGGQREVGKAGLHDPGFKPRHVEQAVEQSFDRFQRSLQIVQQRLRRSVLDLLGQSDGEEGHGLDRLAKIVTGGGQEP